MIRKSTFGIFLLSFLCGFLFADELVLKAKFQPLLSIEEKGYFATEGDFDFTFQRLKLYVTYDDEISGGKTVSGSLSLDFSEKKIEDIVKDAQFLFAPIEPLSFGLGQRKIPFLYNDYCGSEKLFHSVRSLTSKHVREVLLVGGYKKGGWLKGVVGDDYFLYDVGLYYEPELDIEGVSGSEISMLPVIKISTKAIKSFVIDYSILLPLFEMRLYDGSLKRKRVVLQSLSARFKADKLYRTELDLFIGADTTLGKELMQFIPSYDENVSFSLYSNHVFAVPLKETLTLTTAVAGEFLNGLTYYDGLYHDRAYNYGIWTTLGLSYKKKLSFKCGFSERFDNDFQSLNWKQFSFQCTYSPTLLKWEK